MVQRIRGVSPVGEEKVYGENDYQRAYQLTSPASAILTSPYVKEVKRPVYRCQLSKRGFIRKQAVIIGLPPIVRSVYLAIYPVYAVLCCLLCSFSPRSVPLY